MEQECQKTCLHDRHVALGALMSPFAGFDMPIQYAGITEEHNAVRQHVGVFDVSQVCRKSSTIILLTLLLR